MAEDAEEAVEASVAVVDVAAAVEDAVEEADFKIKRVKK